MELDVRPLILNCALRDAHLWARQIQHAGGEILGIEKIDEDEYTVRALVPTQQALNR
jgi:hypothetical protein